MNLARTVNTRLFIQAVLLLLLSAAAVSIWAHRSFAPALLPEVEQQTVAMGHALASQLERPISLGIPLEDLVGVEPILADTMAGQEDLRYLVVTDPQGKALFRQGTAPSDDALSGMATEGTLAAADGDVLDTAVPVVVGGETAAVVHLGVDRNVADRVGRELLIDILTILVVSCLCALELLLFVASVTTTEIRGLNRIAEEAERGRFLLVAGNRSRDELARILAWYGATVGILASAWQRAMQAAAASGHRLPASGYRFDAEEGRAISETTQPLNLVAARLSIFMFVLAEELSRPFFPVYVQEVAGPIPGLSPGMIAALPIAVFMLVWALSQLFGAMWSERAGRRNAFVCGALAGAGGLAMTGLAGGLLDLLFWRCLTAVGYGILMIAVQGVVIDNTSERNRARGFAIFVGGTLAAGVCGPALGGVMADQLGYRATFLLSGVVAIVSSAIMYASVVERGRRSTDGAIGVDLRRAVSLFRNGRFMTLVILSAFPAKLAATGILFYLVPLFLHAEGVAKADIGRALPLYFIGFMAVSPLVARLSDRLAKRKAFMVLGGVLSAVACLAVLWFESLWAASICCLALGGAQALISSPQLALVLSASNRESETLGAGSVLGMFRLMERLGSVASPFIAAALVFYVGYEGAIVGVGAILAVSAVLLHACFRETAAPAAIIADQDISP